MPPLSNWMIRVALAQLGIGFTLGAYMLSAKGIPFDPLYRRLLTAHIELLLFGWLLQLAVGVAFWILPRFEQPPKYGRVKLAWAGFALFNLGLALVIAGGWLGGASHPLALAGHLVEAAAVVLFALFLWPRVKPFMG
jgi:heme/copper-type cytochrome/quinol oxidase subunit 1